MAFWLDEEIGNPLWCLGTTSRCTPSEVIGIWSVVFFYATFLAATVVHSVLQADTSAVGRPRPRRGPPKAHDDDLRALCFLLVYFFVFAAGCLAWVLGGARLVRPLSLWPVQLLGAALLLACAGIFVAVHVALGQNWSPVPERLEGHALVTSGPLAGGVDRGRLRWRDPVPDPWRGAGYARAVRA